MEDIIKDFSSITSSLQSTPHPTSSYISSRQLPTEIILSVLIHLDHHTLLSASFTCHRWYALTHHYRQYIWRHIAWRDFSFIAARGLWKLEFLQDRDLQDSFPPRRDSKLIDFLYVNDDAVMTLDKSVCRSCQQSSEAEIVDGIQTTAKEKNKSLDCSCARSDLAGYHSDTSESKEKEHDWKKLYQQTRNWYTGRARGYCPVILPSLVSLQLAEQTLLNISAKSTLDPDSKLSMEGGVPSPAQEMIQGLLARRKPMAVVGSQYEGSAQTVLSLTKSSANNPVFKTSHRTTLIRSNPHYRVKPAQGNQINNQLFPTTDENSLSLERDFEKPNIIIQDPLEHDHVAFAVHTPLVPSNSSEGNNSGSSTNETNPEQLQQGQSHNNPDPAESDQVQLERDLANDISCHYSSPLHSFLVTGHMSGSVRLWDMTVKSLGQQCIRKWNTTGIRRAHCVGMNSKVVVCGYSDSTLCVWDIHPDQDSTSLSYGTIHVASFLTTPQTWHNGIEHVSVGDSLVACYIDFGGPILVFSLTTGSLVYEIPGSYQPTKMCMTDFFLITGGRRSESGSFGLQDQPQQPNMNNNQHSPMVRHAHHTHGTEISDVDDMTDMTGEGHPPLVEPEEDIGCCVNVWDLRTGNRLYSLVPRMPPDHSNQPITAFKEMMTKGYVQGSDSIESRVNSTTLDSMTNRPRPQPRNSLLPQLSLLDIAVTPDHSTLIVTLCERSGERREGVYCWDFTGSRLNGYHEHGSGLSTMVFDKKDISNVREEYNLNGKVENRIEQEISENNNMVMQQVDTSALRELHQARITGKIWIGWKTEQ